VLARDVDEHQRETEALEAHTKKWDHRLAKITLFVNIAMIGAKMVAAVLSHSLSVVSSVVDSAMDITAGTLIWGACHMRQKNDREKYPIGLNRLEPLAILITAMIMTFANLIVIEESVLSTINNSLGPKVDIATLVILLGGTVVKIVLYVACRMRHSASAAMLAQDQRNDIVTNIVALAGASIGHRWWVYADPLGAVLIAGWIIFSWLGTAKEQIPYLIGRAAKRGFINRIVKVATCHDERIKALDTIYVYHIGANFLVELHVVFDGNLSLEEAHDVAESLQCKLERLPYVDRAFVHCDYKFDGDEHIN